MAHIYPKGIEGYKQTEREATTEGFEHDDLKQITKSANRERSGVTKREDNRQGVEIL